MATTNQIFHIQTKDIYGILDTVKNGELFSIHFTRVAPKCTHCHESNKKWVGSTVCPKCGGVLSLDRETLAQKGVKHPADPNDTPKGTGESAAEALSAGRIKFYDMNAVDPVTKVKGAYRQARIDSITRITVRKIDYVVI